MRLNESPSKKGREIPGTIRRRCTLPKASMKVPPKRKGNPADDVYHTCGLPFPSMKVPPKRKGNSIGFIDKGKSGGPSMKVPPKRKGNHMAYPATYATNLPQ